MDAKDVLKLLRVSRSTLTNYVNNGTIRVIKKHNGFYNYNDSDVYKIAYGDMKRKTCIYARVSAPTQKADLENQIEMLKQWCFNQGYSISAIYSDVASGISFEKRKQFFDMLDDIIEGKVERVVISYKDRLSRVGFDLFYHLFKKYNCEIEVMSEVGSPKLDSEEIFEEIVSLLHCYSMKPYSKRNARKKIKELIDENSQQ